MRSTALAIWHPQPLSNKWMRARAAGDLAPEAEAVLTQLAPAEQDDIGLIYADDGSFLFSTLISLNRPGAPMMRIGDARLAMVLDQFDALIRAELAAMVVAAWR